jgi:carbamoyl-phosphate synthase large subunit
VTNVLITSVGYKLPLIQEFKTALLGSGGKLIGTDADSSSPVASDCDAFLLSPVVKDAQYTAFMQRALNEHEVSLLVPGADRDLEPLFNLRQAGIPSKTKALVTANLDSIRIIQNKYRFAQWCQPKGYPVAPFCSLNDPFDPVGQMTAPWLLRPRVPMAGVANLVVSSPTLLQAHVAVLRAEGRQDQFFVQKLVSEPEYSIDTLMSLDAKPLQAVVRRRSVVRGGESMMTVVEHVPELESLALDVCTSLELVGHNVVQAFWSRQAGASLIEVNHRFGGASRLSIQAGLDSPSRLIRLAQGDQSALKNSPIRYGLAMQRMATDRFIEPHEDNTRHSL